MNEKKRYSSIDILKGIAMIMVIMVHYQQSFGLCKWFHYFEMGCPIFFVCSGFGITFLINHKYSGSIKRKTNLFSFYYSRFKALAPGWYLALVFIFLINTLMILLTGSTLIFAPNRAPLAIIINILFLNGLFPFCNNNVIPGGWYVGTTAILYLLTPLILLLLSKFKSRRLFFALSSVIGMLIWAFLGKFLYGDDFSYNGFSYFFFLVHYPEYLLGIVLYFDLDEKFLTERQIKLCMPIGLIVFAFAYFLFYSGHIPYHNYLSAWATALGTYLVLYFLISYEDKHNDTKIEIVLEHYGKNSYGIFLLHGFWTWSFISFSNKVAEHFGFSIINIPCFIIFIPIVLVCTYYTGIVFNKITKKTTKIIFQ